MAFQKEGLFYALKQEKEKKRDLSEEGSFLCPKTENMPDSGIHLEMKRKGAEENDKEEKHEARPSGKRFFSCTDNQGLSEQEERKIK